jgi:hypothetical protein
MTSLQNNKKLKKIVLHKYGKQLTEEQSKELLRKLGSIYKLIY